MCFNRKVLTLTHAQGCKDPNGEEDDDLGEHHLDDDLRLFYVDR